MKRPIITGAVLYDPAVSVIWEIIRQACEARDVAIDTVFFTNYELQIDALMRDGIDIAWNSPLAHLDAMRQANNKCKGLAMRDTDRDRSSHVVVKKDSGIDTLAQLKGKPVGFGAADSPQATLIPKEHLLRAGLGESDYTTRRFDVLVGKHGDHIGGERDAFKALEMGEVVACWMIDLNWNNWTKDGTVNPDKYRILDTTAKYDHCVFTVKDTLPVEKHKPFIDTLLAMDYSNPAHKQMMDMEGLKKWLPGRTTGFDLLAAACKNQKFFDRK